MPEPAPVRPPGSSLATASLVLGALSILLFVVAPLFVVPEVICGQLARRRAEWAPQPAGVFRRALVGRIMGIIGIALWAVLWFLLFVTPNNGTPEEFIRRVNCRGQVKCICLGCRMYADDSGGQFPPDFQTLVEYYHDSFQNYECPSAKRAPATNLAEFVTNGQGDYAYFGAGLNQATVKNPDRTIMIADKTGNHDGYWIRYIHSGRTMRRKDPFGNHHAYWSVGMVNGQVMELVDPHNVGFATAARQNGWIIPGAAPP